MWHVPTGADDGCAPVPETQWTRACLGRGKDSPSAALALALAALAEGMARSNCFGSMKVERGTCCSHTLTNNVRRTVEAGVATQAAGGTSSDGAPCSKRPARNRNAPSSLRTYTA
jgi:hypothetical protein